MLVTPEQAETLALASTEGKIQLALRNPLDQGAPQTPGIRPAVLLGVGPRTGPRARSASAAPAKPKPGQPISMVGIAAPALPTVEIIRGDKRATEIIK